MTVHLCVLTEGQTGEAFVRDVLAPRLSHLGVYPVARSVLTGRKRGRNYRGGVKQYAHVRNDLGRWLRERSAPNCRFTTLIDLYALPADFPGYAGAMGERDVQRRVAALESAFRADIADARDRFLPYIQLHEFEALLFSALEAFVYTFPDQEADVRRLVDVAQEFGSPEKIDDGHDTCPSRRIQSVFPGHRKVLFGPMLALEIGLDPMRAACPHFNEWLGRLEALGRAGATP